MKKLLFFENAKLLNEEFGIIPLMYGSLGLEYITDESLNSDDVDILIPKIFLNVRWSEFTDFLLNKGYVLVDEHEHTFQKRGILYSYAPIEELENFAEIRLSEINQYRKDEVQFKLLSLEQYLKVYEASAKDGYRVNIRKKKDNEKIAFIKKQLKYNTLK